MSRTDRFGWRMWVAVAAVLLAVGALVTIVVVRATADKPITVLAGRAWIRSVAFSPDGRLLAAGMSDNGFWGEVTLWDVPGRRKLATLDTGGSVSQVTFSPDGRTLAVASRPVTATDGVVQLWDVGTRRRVDGGTVTELVYDVAFSPDGRTLAVAGATNPAIWDLRTHRRTQLLPGQQFALTTAVAFSPDGRWLAIGFSEGPHGRAELWDARSRHRVRGFDNDDGAVPSLAFSPDSRTLVIASDTTTLFDVATGDRIARLRPVDYVVAAVAFSPDGHTLATGSTDGRTRLWDPATRHAGTSWKQKAAVFGLAYSPDGRTLATGSSDGLVRIWAVP